MQYNYKNLICRIKDPRNNVVGTYEYDANGRRVEKALAGGVIEHYVHSGVEAVCVYDGTNGLKREFVFGRGRGGTPPEPWPYALGRWKKGSSIDAQETVTSVSTGRSECPCTHACAGGDVCANLSARTSKGIPGGAK